MSRIQLLDQETINQIAAGEVIDRPSSIVKELLENAIDAGSTMVTVEIKDGGLSMIRITDNGIGIAKDDIKTAFLRHSTSKIRSVEDLLSVSSLGFRGEALSSIAAVCQVELITKTKESLTGIRYVIEGGNEKSFDEIGAPEGTTFIARNIFFNTPARRKFLKTAQTEAGYISEIVERITLSHPEVSIRFINNGQGRIHTPGNGNLKDVIYNIYGRDIANNLIEVSTENDMMNIRGHIGKPIISKGNRTFENYYINGRYIKSTLITKAIEEAYKPYMMQHKYPFTALHIEISSELLDVNVHPAKMELRFRNSESIYPFIVESLSEALKEKPLIPEVSMDEEKKVNSMVKHHTPKMPEPFEVNRIQKENLIQKENVIPKENLSLEDTNSKENTGLKADVSPKEYISEKNDENTHQIDKIEHNNMGDFVKKNLEETNENSLKKSRPSVVSEDSSYNVSITKENTMSLFETDFISEAARPKHKIIGQVFDTYWIVEFDGKMFIIDQHAAHEKVLYEELMEKLSSKEVASQNLNPPIIISLSVSEEILLNKYMDAFNSIGFEIESFGGQEYAVRAVPLDLYTLNKKELIMDMIDNLDSDISRLSSQLLTEKIASMSCKAAVKGNNKLSVAEADELIDRLLGLENPYNCPHGRPTIISMSKYELEKKFKRIV